MTEIWLNISDKDKTMMNRRLTEMRKNRRFMVKPESLYVLNNDSSERGEVVDISMGGLSCCQVDCECPAGANYCRIVMSDNNENVVDLPLSFVSERALIIGRHDNSTRIWRRGWQFGDMSPQQMAVLNDFIVHNVINGDEVAKC